MTAPSGPGRVLEVVARTPRDALLPALLENLARGLGSPDAPEPRIRLLQRLADGHLQRLATWPADAPSFESEVADQHPVPGVGVLEIVPRPDLSVARCRRLLSESCLWIGATVRAERAVRELERIRQDARQSVHEAERAEVRAGRVREGERMRLVESITTATVHDVAELRRLLAQPADAVEWPAVHALTERLIDELRDTVRGVFPAMLPARGVEETLRELAAASGVHVTVVGDLGRRTSWDVESGFYHAVAGSLRVLARAGEPLRLALHRASGPVATIRARGCDRDATERALRMEIERIGSLGGGLSVRERDDDEVEIIVTMPDRGEVRSLPLTHGDVVARPVFARVSAMVDAAGLPAAELIRCHDALAAPVTLLVVQGPAPAPMPGVQTVLCDEAPDARLGADVRDRRGRWGSIDAVVCALAPQAGFVDALPSDRLLFRDGVSPAEAVATLSARAPVIVARRVIGVLAEAASRVGDEPLLWEIDRLRAHSHELVEDDLLDQFARGGAHPLVDADAAVLAGAAGGDARARLALPADATDEQVRAAALAVAERWRQAADRPGLGRSGRWAAEVLQRSAAGLIDPDGRRQ
ncbi:hypothetical protein [uncultured Microbacterium sp.]|uniref:hypothetical protein n=1 Tax=uncultured Microbacterium sp. TaxID=191216 RepID=UPI0025CE4DEC|nr:hypothetical protein [uncultured Microbacterium sp.]